MKLLALGAGEMGEAAAVTAASFAEVDQLIVADLSLDRAGKVAARCRGKAISTSIDVTLHEELVALMRQADVVMNCVGPFFRFGVPILQAAIEARRPYCDLCDDPEPTLAMLQMTPHAQEAGVTAVIGVGASPGLTNLLARLAYESLDHVDELMTAWNIETSEGGARLEYSMAIVHWMQQISGSILECQNGRLENVPPLRKETLHYPGCGERTVWTVGHPEPISLSWTYPGLKRSYCAMVMSSLQSGAFVGLQQAIDQGKLTLEAAARELVESSQEDSWLSRMVESVSSWFDGPNMPLFFAMARGAKAGVPATTATSMRAQPCGTADATGIPLALCARLMAQGKLATPGVHPIESVVAPQEFFDLLHPYCVSPRPVAREELVEIVTHGEVAP